MGKRDPLGENTFKGLGVPLYGESIIQQQNSSNTIMTLMHSTANTGAYLSFMNYKNVDGDPASSVVTDLIEAVVDAGGSFEVRSGTTVIMELNSSGLYGAGGKQLMSSVGTQVTVALDGATTQHTILSSNAGKLHIISTQAASSVFIHLPSSGTLTAGMKFEFVANTSGTDLFHFMTTGANAGGEIHAHVGTTNAIKTTGAITNLTSGALWAEFVCVSPVGPIWFVSNKMAENGGLTTNYYLAWAAGTTA